MYLNQKLKDKKEQKHTSKPFTYVAKIAFYFVLRLPKTEKIYKLSATTKKAHTEQKRRF